MGNKHSSQWCTLNDTSTCDVIELCVRNIPQSNVVSTVSDLIGCNEKKIPTATNVWWIPKIYTWNFVVNCLHPNNNGMLSTRAPRDVSRDISVKVLGFQRQSVFNTKLQQRCGQFQTSSYWKRDEKCQQSVLCWLQLMAASGNFARFPKLQENGVKGWYKTPLFRWFT